MDVSVFDQSGCASPHNLYIERGSDYTRKFCEILADVFRKQKLKYLNQLYRQNKFLLFTHLGEYMTLKVKFGEAIQCHGLYFIQKTMNFASLYTQGCLWYILLSI